jgi:hypothetical protein
MSQIIRKATGGSVSDAAYGAGWNGDTTTAPSKNAVYDKIQTLAGGSQTYSVFVYNSSGSQSGNRFNTFSDLMTATAAQEGPKVVIIEQDETIPTTGMPLAGWNFDYTEFRGNGKSYNQGGFTVTFPTGVLISSWTFGIIDSLRFRSTSTSPIWTTASGFLLQINIQAELWTTTAPFIQNTGGGQCILSLGRAGRIKDDGYEVFETTAGDFGCVLVVTRADNSTIANETLRSSNPVIFLDLVQNVTNDLATNGFPSTHTNLSIAIDFSSIQTNRAAMIGSKNVMADATSITPITGATINQQGNTQVAGTLTINAPTGFKGVGSETELVIIPTNNQTYSWNSVYRDSANLVLPTSITGGTTDRIKFIWNDADSKWDLTRLIRSAGTSAPTYSETNVTTDRTFNANATSIDELADVVGTLIADLRNAGVIK